AGTFIIAAAPGIEELLHSLASETGCTIVGLDTPLGAATLRQSMPRIGVYQSWRASIDEGWTRWVLEEYGFPYTTLHDSDIRNGSLRSRVDTLVLPQQPPDHILNGNPEKNDYKEPYPPEYVGGLGALGVEALRTFVHAGGTLVALDSSARFAIRYLYLPVRDVVEGLPETTFYCPGSLLRILVDGESPLGYGLRREEVALFLKSPVFDIDHEFLPDVNVIARYPHYEPNLSGWILGAEHLAGKAALVEVRIGAGRVVLFGFRPQFRAQARGTYRLLFNALLRSGLEA
ncbi:MAG: peptidase M14, partial [Chloroflexi bacterium]